MRAFSRVVKPRTLTPALSRKSGRGGGIARFRGPLTSWAAVAGALVGAGADRAIHGCRETAPRRRFATDAVGARVYIFAAARMDHGLFHPRGTSRTPTLNSQ